MLRASEEIRKQFADEFADIDEDAYRREYIKAIQRVFDTNIIESEILMYLAEWDWYARPMDNMDFTLTWDDDKNQILAKVYQPWWYNIIYEFNAGYDMEIILSCLEQIDREKK